MDVSVETVHTRIIGKIDLLRTMICDMRDELEQMVENMNPRFKHKKAELNSKLPIFGIYLNNLDKLEDEYSVDAAVMLGVSEEANDDSYRDKIISSSVINKLDYIHLQLMELTQSLPKLPSNLMQMLNNYKNTKVVVRSRRIIEYDMCEKCEQKMISKPEESCFECDICGIILPMPGAALDKTGCFSQEGQRVRQGTHDPDRHISKWLDNIQAKDNRTIPELVVEDIRECAIRDYTRVDFNGNKIVRKMKNMKCKQVRGWLQETRHTKYNDYSTQIRKIITGVVPYQLNYDEEQLVRSRVRRIVDVFNDIKSEEGYFNMRYYPYCIFKIIESSFPRNSPPWSLLECIHLQSEETVDKNDRILKKICDRAPDLPRFQRTDRNILREMNC